MSKQPHQMPVMKARCKTCPFNEDGCKSVRAAVLSRITDGSQHCHSSGWPEGTHLCRGARDVQLQWMHRLGVISEPTDEAWNKAWEAMG